MKVSEQRIQGVRVDPEALVIPFGHHRPASLDASPLSLPIDEERRRLLIACKDTAASYPSACIHQLFEAQVARTPLAPAILFRRERLTYRDLNARANQLAHYPRARGVTRETLVGVCVERSLDMIVALLGIFKAGGGYVALDPDYPSAHLAFMLEGQPGGGHLDSRAVGRQASARCPGDLSGRAPRRLRPATRGEPAVRDNAGRSLSEIFVPLLQGIPALIVADDAVKDPLRLVDRLAARSVTRLVLVPSLLRDILALADDLDNRLARLKIWVSSGEALSEPLFCRAGRPDVPDRRSRSVPP